MHTRLTLGRLLVRLGESGPFDLLPNIDVEEGDVDHEQ